MGARDVFVVAGDADAPAGIYEGAAPLLRDMHEIGHPFAQIGITGYPETHPLIDDATATAAMAEKAPYANYIATQICFDSSVTARWIADVWAPRRAAAGLRRDPGRRAACEAVARLHPHRHR